MLWLITTDADSVYAAVFRIEDSETARTLADARMRLAMLLTETEITLTHVATEEIAMQIDETAAASAREETEEITITEEMPITEEKRAVTTALARIAMRSSREYRQ